MSKNRPSVPEQKRRVLVPVEAWPQEAWQALAEIAGHDDTRVQVVGPTDVVVRNP